MGGRGANSGVSNTDISRSKSIQREMINDALNSRFAGIRAKAEEGSGNYAFKNAKAVTYTEAMKMQAGKVHERGDNTLIDGYLENGTHVFYANRTSSPEIKSLTEKVKRRSADQDTTIRRPDMTGKETTTYDRWRKKQQKKFDNWWKK